ncbi:MAG TPA: acetamidase/formamidase family protein [Thermoanaerobaculia bacterium]|nr:acetamidase/formamidase family protein [Thermoanaerobaculia bacterium]
MRRAILLTSCLLACLPIRAARSAEAADWLITTDLYGIPLHQRLVLTIADGKLTGELGGDKLEGTLSGKAIHFIAKGDSGDSAEYTGTLDGDTISGQAVLVDGGDKSRTPGAFTAHRLPERPPGPPRRHEFTPTTYYRQFSAATQPVLTVWPGDTIHTTTVDAGGTDAGGVTRVFGGNPQTGPFYVETALPGDVLAVHIDHLRLNRDYAISTDGIVGRAMSPQVAMKMKDAGKTVRWHLDRERGVATPENPTDHLKQYTVPLLPMLGCVGVAPGFAAAPSPTGDSGRFGGNMDFSEVAEGATVYLPVMQPGALLYVGDAHAAQGDGELTGDALETSMDVEITIDVLPHKSIQSPRVESPTHIMAVGLAGSLDDALRTATASLSQWLEQDYKLTPSEIAQVLGTAVEYSVNEIADRNVGIVAKVKKERLATLVKDAAAK